MDPRDIIPAAITAAAIAGMFWLIIWMLLHTPATPDRTKRPRPETLRDMQIHTAGVFAPETGTQRVTVEDIISLIPDSNHITIDPRPFDKIRVDVITADKLTATRAEFASPSREDKIGASE